MYSVPAVECVLNPDEGLLQIRPVSYLLDHDDWHRWGSNPQLRLGMYSETAVRMSSNQTTDEVMNQRRYGALPLSYGATLQVAPAGLEPTTPGS
jgi:hypothetical protein